MIQINYELIKSKNLQALTVSILLNRITFKNIHLYIIISTNRCDILALKVELNQTQTGLTKAIIILSPKVIHDPFETSLFRYRNEKT